MQSWTSQCLYIGRGTEDPRNEIKPSMLCISFSMYSVGTVAFFYREFKGRQ